MKAVKAKKSVQKNKHVYEDAKHEVETITPGYGRLATQLKAWPTQSVSGIIQPDSYTMIRGDLYLARVLKSSETIEDIKKGDAAIFSSFSGYHIQTKESLVKILNETDILAYKHMEEAEKGIVIDPRTFTPGLDCILVSLLKEDQKVTEAGIIHNLDGKQEQDTPDAHSKTAVIEKIGRITSASKGAEAVKVGKAILLSSYVGTELPQHEVTSKIKYRIMYINDILGYVN